MAWRVGRGVRATMSAVGDRVRNAETRLYLLTGGVVGENGFRCRRVDCRFDCGRSLQGEYESGCSMSSKNAPRSGS